MPCGVRLRWFYMGAQALGCILCCDIPVEYKGCGSASH
jgi:hypothetical protein